MANRFIIFLMMNFSSCVVDLVKQHSRAPCTKEISYGCRPGGTAVMWVDKGCRGTFLLLGGHDPTPTNITCGIPGGRVGNPLNCSTLRPWSCPCTEAALVVQWQLQWSGLACSSCDAARQPASRHRRRRTFLAFLFAFEPTHAQSGVQWYARQFCLLARALTSLKRVNEPR